MIDLLESMRIKDAIEASPESLQAILESTPLAICVTNADRNFVAVNDNYTQLYGYSREELIGKGFTIVVPDAYKETMNLLHDKFLQDKQEIAREWDVQRKDGSLIRISVDAGYTEKIDGKPHKITLISRES